MQLQTDFKKPRAPLSELAELRRYVLNNIDTCYVIGYII